MARNVEIKARAADLQAVEARVRPLADQGPIELHQDDTFFRCDQGRLKLRDFGDGHGELIFYRRADQLAPKCSHYEITVTDEPARLREVLTQALGVVGRVRKRRTLYLVGATRVHLDEVDELGCFVELEVVLQSGEPIEQGEATARALLKALQIADDALLAPAYVDLLQSR
ncbi:class IV adenylate cyclase [Caldimonas brevitalea]|uniref:Adenylate cyclase n=1 Tax=Caldimonas brevitalea TaxID=413882 RepID=A0A0G3BRR4_9BURK|nr:class IV adenylate cyclase [Caldimonas brevitalea]AKJ32119.1 adenylate cyclase [Caldimonas brevitalea]